MIYKTFDIALELKQTSTNPTFTVVEGDTGNRLRITVTDGGSPVDLTGCRVIAVFSKSTGLAVQDSAGENGGVEIGGTYNNVVTINIFSPSIAPGNVECELQIYSGEQSEVLITTARFNFKCNRAVMNGDALQSEEEFPLLVNLIKTVQGFVNDEELRKLAEAERQAEYQKWANAEAEATALPEGSAPTVDITEREGKKIFSIGIPRSDVGGAMLKSDYDTDNDGAVDRANEADHADNADNADMLGGKPPSEYQEAGDYASPAKLRTVTLGMSNWIGAEAPFTQTVTVNGVLADETKQAIHVSPSAGYGTMYGTAGIECTAQGNNSLTFSCGATPQSDIVLNIAIQEAGA